LRLRELKLFGYYKKDNLIGTPNEKRFRFKKSIALKGFLEKACSFPFEARKESGGF
jgi:hypothetical protein